MRTKRTWGLVVLVTAFVGVFAAPGASAAILEDSDAAFIPSPTVVISQVYGGGNNAGATYQNDFIELFNRGTVDQPIDGWSLQYASSTGTSWTNSVPLSGTIPAGRYFLVRLAGGTTNGIPLPDADATGTVNMSGTAGKVVLLNVATPPTAGTVCPTGPTVVDIVGYGTGTNCVETAPTATLSNTTAAIRNGAGCVDTDNNAADFTVATPTPRNSFTTRNLCAGDAAPTVASTTPANTATNVPLNSNVTVTFSEPVNVTDSWFTISCTTSGSQTATVSGGPTTFTLDPNTDFVNDETCTVTVVAAQVSDVDTDDPPDTMEANYVFSFTTASLVDDAPTVVSTSPANNATNVAPSADVTITFSEPVNAPASAFSVSCTVSGPHPFALSGGPTTFTMNPTTDFVESERCTVRVVAANVSDQDTNDPPDTMAADHVFAFDTVQVIPIGTVQGPVGPTTDGATHRSPFAPAPTNPSNPCATSAAGTQTVYVRGVIYQKTLARTSAGGSQHGFFIQNTAATRDADPNTSDGIWVFMGSNTTLIGGYAPTVGDEVVLSARVTEFNCLTQLTSASLVRLVRSGVVVNAELPPFIANPPDYVEDANRYWERLEGMRGQAPVGSITVGRRQVFSPAGTMDGEDAFIAPTHPVALRPNEYARRTYRDPHPADNRPELWDDGNGFRIILGSLGIKAAANDNTALIAPARTYDRIAVSPPGGLYFSFSKYIIMPEAQITLTPGADPSQNAPPRAPSRPDEYSMADYNVENLYDYRDDPFDGCDFAGNTGCTGVSPPFDYVPSSQIEYEMRLRDVATQIIQDLHSPEIIMTQEAEDQDICTVTGATLTCGTTNNADGKPDTLQELALVIRSLGGPAYDAAFDRDGADARGIISPIMYRTDRVELLPASPGHPVLGSSPTVSYRGTPLAYNTQVQNPKVLNAVRPADVDTSTGVDGPNVFTRPPQVGHFRIWEQPGRTGTFFDVYAISNHFSSTPQNRVGQRREQARYNAAIVQAIQAVEPQARIDAAGDYNVFPRPDDPYSPPHSLYPTDQLAPLYDAGMINLWDVAAAEVPVAAYSYVFDMQAQTLDMHFVTPSLRAELRQFRMAHVNADYPTEFDSPGARGISDHDPGVAIFAAPAGSTDLAVTKTGSTDTVYPGAVLTYTLTVRNNGPSTATGVTLTDTLPETASFVGVTSTQGTCEGRATVTCNLGTLASGATARVTLDVRATRAGSMTNTAEVRGGQADPAAANNSASVTTTVVMPPRARPADRGCQVTAAPRGLTAGKRAVLRVSVAMVGPREPAARRSVVLRGAGVRKNVVTGAGGTVRVAVKPTRAGAITVRAPGAEGAMKCVARVTVRRARAGTAPALTGRP